MHQYNDLAIDTKHLRLGLCLLLGLLVGGCAHSHSPVHTSHRASQGATHLSQGPSFQAYRINNEVQHQAVHDDVPSHMRTLPAQRTVATIPAAVITTMMNAPRLISKAELEQAAYIVAFRDHHLLASENAVAFVRFRHPNTSEQNAPTQFDIVRADTPLTDPETGKPISFLALAVGELQIMRRNDNIGTARITKSALAIQPGDRVLPARSRINTSAFHLHRPDQPVSAVIIATHGNRSIVGDYDVVAINRGARSGLERGHLLQIQRPSRSVPDPIKGDTQVTLPPLTIGTLMLFDVSKQTSLGIVLQSSHAIHTLDRVSTPAP